MTFIGSIVNTEAGHRNKPTTLTTTVINGAPLCKFRLRRGEGTGLVIGISYRVGNTSINTINCVVNGFINKKIPCFGLGGAPGGGSLGALNTTLTSSNSITLCRISKMAPRRGVTKGRSIRSVVFISESRVSRAHRGLSAASGRPSLVYLKYPRTSLSRVGRITSVIRKGAVGGGL